MPDAKGSGMRLPGPALPPPYCLALSCKHGENKFRFPGNIYLRPCGERVHRPPRVLPAGWPGAICGATGRARKEGRALGLLLRAGIRMLLAGRQKPVFSKSLKLTYLIFLSSALSVLSPPVPTSKTAPLWCPTAFLPFPPIFPGSQCLLWDIFPNSLFHLPSLRLSG